MITAPKIQVPPGMTVREQDDGTYIVEKSEVAFSKTVAFRMSSAMFADMLPFLASFPQRSWASGMRWLLEQPETVAAIERRMSEQTKLRAAKQD